VRRGVCERNGELAHLSPGQKPPTHKTNDDDDDDWYKRAIMQEYFYPPGSYGVKTHKTRT
jgi:hypothetical protein